MIALGHAGWSLTLLPELGGAIGSLRHAGHDVLRPTPADARGPLETACFPLVPYANRIAGGRFVFDGQDYHLPRNADGQAHPLHGVGWQRAWEVAAVDARSVTLRHEHPGDGDWPWAYAAEQEFRLAQDGLHLSLSVTNRDSRPMPAGLGFHPYFPATADTRLGFEAQSVWLADAEMLPTAPAAAAHFADWSAGDGVRRTSLIDNAYAGWSGEARIASPSGTLRLTGDGTPYLHVFTPPGEDYFCAEPVSDMPDALNRAPTVTVLAPGQTRRIAMSIGLE
jgi:aldose 1-epimerase